MTKSKENNHETTGVVNSPKIGRPRSDVPVLPIYDSMAACEAATGLPMAMLKDAKKAGCDAFRSNRVDLARLLRWLGARGEDSGVNWGAEFEKYRAKREKIKHDKESKLTADKGEVVMGLGKIQATLFASLERMRHEGPPAWKGLDEVPIFEKFGKQIDGLKDELSAAFERLEKGDSEPVN